MTSHFSRRALLASGASLTGLALAPPLRARTAAQRFPDSRALRRMIEPSLKQLGAAARVERLGQSAGGRPIDLVSIGNGPRAALIVGAPHPNEPIGCLTIVRLIERLAGDRAFRDRSGFTWHFIPAIDVDGLDLNAGWFRGPLTLERYFRDFFRPAFSVQPEYAFPLELPGYRFDAATPENLCWQRAIDIARPQLQSSLHGNDSSGAFYLLSRDDAALAATLSRQPAARGIAINDLGEPDSQLDRYAPGVFSFFEVGPWLRKQQQAGAKLSEIWSAGRSSAEFAAERFGTLSVTCEVPLWLDPRQFDRRPSRYNTTAVARLQLDQAAENLRLLTRAAPLLDATSSSPETHTLRLALNEALAALPGQKRALESHVHSDDRGNRVSLGDLVQLEPGTTAMRAPAMLARLARLERAPDIAAAAETILSRRIAAFQAATTLRPIPTPITTALQMASITTAMARLCAAR